MFGTRFTDHRGKPAVRIDLYLARMRSTTSLKGYPRIALNGRTVASVDDLVAKTLSALRPETDLLRSKAVSQPDRYRVDSNVFICGNCLNTARAVDIGSQRPVGLAEVHKEIFRADAKPVGQCRFRTCRPLRIPTWVSRLFADADTKVGTP